MGFHHIAFAAKDTEATHRFYTDVMGFELVKVVASELPPPHTGYSKHYFYSTGDATTGDHGMIAFWEINDPEIGDDFEPNLNKAAGLPGYINHFAFDAPNREALDAHRRRWQEHGHRVVEIDHEFCVSIYINDPTGNMVEFCMTSRPFTPEEKVKALELLMSPQPELEKEYSVTIHQPLEPAVTD